MSVQICGKSVVEVDAENHLGYFSRIFNNKLFADIKAQDFVQFCGIVIIAITESRFTCIPS